MNKLIKKVMAAALAFTLIGGGMPALTGGGFDVLKPAIVANAAETKTIAEGVRYHKGDTIHLDSEACIILDDVGPWEIVPAGDYLFDSDPYYYDVEEQFVFPNVFGNRSLWLTSRGSDNPNEVEGIFVESGDGSEYNSYSIKPVFRSELYAGVFLRNTNVALDDSITLRFYVQKRSCQINEVNGVTMTGPNGPINVTSFTTDDTGYNYVFSYPLYATQLDEDVTIQFKKDDNIVHVNSRNSYSYKVNDYCDYVIANNKNEFDDSTVNAVKSLKNLGIAADNYFDNTSTPISFLRSDYSHLRTFAPTFNSNQGKLSLVFDSKLSVRLYIDGLTAGKKSQAISSLPIYTSIAGKDGKACFELTNLNPIDLGELYNIKYNNETYSFSALSYCARALDSTNPKAVDIAKAVYDYYVYIETYQLHNAFD